MLRKTWLHSGWELANPRWLEPPSRLGYSGLEWLPASVPGHVHADLLRNSVIADPFAGLAELGCQWVDGERWSYRTRFEFTADAALPRRVLRFEGLDTLASVWLDGEKLAEHDDMFVPLELELGTRLTNGSHDLRVDLEPAVAVGAERRARYLASQGIPGNVVRFDERAFVQKAQYMYGWDWGPRLVSAGIWRPVALLEFRGRVLDVHVEQTHHPNGHVELRITSQHEGPGNVVHFLDDAPAVVADGSGVSLERPELWWPAGLGAQARLTVTSYLVEGHVASREEAERRALDRKTTRVGLRTLRLVREPDRYGESFELEVNGRRLYCLGANWIPDHSLPSLVTRARLRAGLERARDMNMNTLRVWGGGLYESDDFYELTDELGLLVWQDFPYACQYYPEDAASLAAARRQARANVRRLRHHPSLALWCGNNENLMMFQSGWDDPERHPPRYYGRAIFEDVLPSVLAELDPARPYIPTSPWGGEVANGGGVGDQHYWDVWHGRGDWKHYADATGRFVSEFGFASAPGPRAWRRILPELEQPLAADVRHPAARWHDKTLKGYETFLELTKLHYPAAEDLEAWTYYSQLNQRDALRFGIESFRRSDFCRGALVWQLNDCWPVQSWAVVDSEGDYKAAAYELRRLFAPALASLVFEGETTRLWAILDNAGEGLRSSASLEARSLSTGRTLARVEAEVALAPGERRAVLELGTRGCEATDTIVLASFAGTTTFRLLSEPKHVRLRAPHLTATLAPGGVVVTTDVPVVDLFLWDAAGAARFDLNFLTLPETSRVHVRTSEPPRELCARSLAGRHEISLRRA